MDANKFIFEGNDIANGNIAVDALMARLRTVKDSKGQVIWKSVQSGLALPIQDIYEADAPAIWVYESNDKHLASASNLLCDTDVLVTVSLFCYLYVNPKLDWEYANIQPIRRNITRATIKHLNGKMAGNPNGFDEVLPTWRFVKPQIINVDYTDVLRPHFPDVSALPDWWLWRIDLALQTLNTLTNGV